VAVTAAALLVLVTHVPLSAVLSLGTGALCLLWLIVVLTVPWNLYFQARRLLRELPVSRERGITVPAGREEEARRIAVRLLWLAVGAHGLSAVVIAVISYFSGKTLGYWFSAFYLVSTVLRPAQAYLAHIRTRLTGMLHETRFPRQDVTEIAGRLKRVEDTVEELSAAGLELGRQLEALRHESAQRDEALDGKLRSLGRRFEETVNELTDNQEVIGGIKAFLRLLRTEQA
jgi:hypothetical protein